MTLWRAAGLALLLMATAEASAAKDLDIYFVDVEGGQATLIVTPTGQSILIDAGYAGRGGRGQRGVPPTPPAPAAGPPFLEPGRDPTRILNVLKEAGIDKLDYLLVTHFHPDHVGGVPELASRIAIGTFIDYGVPLGFDRMTAGGFRNYEPVRTERAHIRVKAGDRLPFTGIEADVVSADGVVLEMPLQNGGESNTACKSLEDHPEDGTENFRSIGVMFRLGAFRFLDLGDLSGNTLTSLACPKNILGPVSAYLIAHHGDYDSNVPALYAALRPQVAIMNNGPTRGGAPDTFRTTLAQAEMDLWQLHESRDTDVENAPDSFIANVDDGVTSYWLKLTASADGRFTVVNQRTGFSKTYSTRSRQP